MKFCRVGLTSFATTCDERANAFPDLSHVVAPVCPTAHSSNAKRDNFATQIVFLANVYLVRNYITRENV